MFMLTVIFMVIHGDFIVINGDVMVIYIMVM